MVNISQSECRICGKTIYWHKSKAGKNYPCDSATDRRAFHKCSQQPEARFSKILDGRCVTPGPDEGKTFREILASHRNADSEPNIHGVTISDDDIPF